MNTGDAMPAKSLRKRPTTTGGRGGEWPKRLTPARQPRPVPLKRDTDTWPQRP